MPKVKRCTHTADHGKGDNAREVVLHSNPARIPAFERELLDLVAQGASGRLIISGPRGETGWVWLRDGYVCGVSAACRTPLLAARLAAFGVLSRAQIHNALNATRTAPGTRLIDILLSKRGVPEEFLVEFATKTAGEHLSVALAGGVVATRFENGRLPPTSTLLIPARLVLDQATGYSGPTRPRQSWLLAVDTSAHEGLSTIQQAIVRSCGGAIDTIGVADRFGLTTREAIELVEPLIESGAVLALDQEPEVDLTVPAVTQTHLVSGHHVPQPREQGPTAESEPLSSAAASTGPSGNLSGATIIGGHDSGVSLSGDAGPATGSTSQIPPRTPVAAEPSRAKLGQREDSAALSAKSGGAGSAEEDDSLAPDEAPDSEPAAESPVFTPAAGRRRQGGLSAREALQELHSLGQRTGRPSAAESHAETASREEASAKGQVGKRRKFFTR